MWAYVIHVQYNTRYVCGRMLYMYSIILVMCVGVSHVQYNTRYVYGRMLYMYSIILVMCVGVYYTCTV